jgi:hypothetical protein
MLQYKLSNSGSWATMRVTEASTLAATLTTLTAGKHYDIQVGVFFSTGNAGYSSVQTHFLNRVPSQVTGLSVTQTAVSGRLALRVSWSKPQSDATITRYEVQYRVSNSGRQPGLQ